MHRCAKKQKLEGPVSVYYNVSRTCFAGSLSLSLCPVYVSKLPDTGKHTVTEGLVQRNPLRYTLMLIWRL